MFDDYVDHESARKRDHVVFRARFFFWFWTLLIAGIFAANNLVPEELPFGKAPAIFTALVVLWTMVTMVISIFILAMLIYHDANIAKAAYYHLPSAEGWQFGAIWFFSFLILTYISGFHATAIWSGIAYLVGIFFITVLHETTSAIT